ncbi:unnamed protein product, partial [Closterium sp. Naga37s-1]
MINVMPTIGCGRRIGLAALVATLMFVAAFVPHAKALRLLSGSATNPATSAEPCTVNCGENSLPTSAEPCTVNNCGENSFCYKNAAGEDTCGCNDGFTMTASNGCQETCLTKMCGFWEECVDHEGGATCECRSDSVRVAGSCVEACAVNNCGQNSVCYRDAAMVDTCACDDRYTMTATDGCQASEQPSGASPPPPGASPPPALPPPPPPSQGHLLYHECANSNDCPAYAVCTASWKCDCETGFAWNGTHCTEACTVNNCGENSFCYKNAAGEDTCGCNDGYTMTLSDGCQDSCVLMDCGPGNSCEIGKCLCFNGYTWSTDGKTCVDPCTNYSGCEPGGTCKFANGVPFCVCNPGFTPTSDNQACI